jgi:uncharacterized protein
MGSVNAKIGDEIKTAMLARDKDKLEALRAVKSAFTLAMAESGSHDIAEENEISILRRMVKQRNDAAVIYKEQGREDLASQELFQASVIETFLPAAMPEEEIMAVIQQCIADTGASGMKDMGKVMGMAAKVLAGRADNKLVSELVKKALAG